MPDLFKPKVAVVGSVNHDSTIECAHLPGPGETIQGSNHSWGLGGKGANQAVGAARAGGATHMLGAVGTDQVGSDLRGVLSGHGVDVSELAGLPGTPTGVAHIHVQRGGENHIVISPGANGTLTDLSERQRQVLSAADVLLLQLEIPMEGVVEAARVAQAAQVPVILTPAPAVPLPSELLECVDLILPNRVELEQLTGTVDLVDGARNLASAGMDVVVTLGADGCMWVSKTGEVVSTAGRQVPVVDSTGAGDCFTGAFAVAWAADRDIPAAMEIATVAASLSVQKSGAASSMPSYTEIQVALRSGVVV
ncbi:MAG: ribokinase [Propionibacteriaceae bacterium]